MSSHASTHNRGNQVNQGIGGFHIPPSQGSGIAAGGQTGTSARVEESHAPVTLKPVSEHFHEASAQQKQGDQQQQQRGDQQHEQLQGQQDVKQSLKQDLNQDVNRDPKHDVNQNVNQDLKLDPPLRHADAELQVHRQQQGAESRAADDFASSSSPHRPRDTGQQMWDQRSAQTRLEDAAASSQSQSQSQSSGHNPKHGAQSAATSVKQQGTQAQGGAQNEQLSAVDCGRPQGDDAGAAAAGNAFQ